MKIDPRDIAPHHEDHKIRRRLIEASGLLLATALLAFALQYLPFGDDAYRKVLTWIAIALAIAGVLSLAAAGVLLEVHKVKIMWRNHHLQ